MKKRTHYLTLAAVIAAAYVVLTLPFAQFSFGIVQFRLAEAMTVIAALTPAAIPGLTIGCLLANLLNPNNLGPVDIFGGSMATLISAVMTWKISVYFRKQAGNLNTYSENSISNLNFIKKIITITPAVVINALVVGTYLPFLLLEDSSAAITLGTVILSILSILLCEAIVVYLIGFPLMIGLARTNILNKHIK